MEPTTTPPTSAGRTTVCLESEVARVEETSVLSLAGVVILVGVVLEGEVVKGGLGVVIGQSGAFKLSIDVGQEESRCIRENPTDIAADPDPIQI